MKKPLLAAISACAALTLGCLHDKPPLGTFTLYGYRPSFRHASANQYQLFPKAKLFTFIYKFTQDSVIVTLPEQQAVAKASILKQEFDHADNDSTTTFYRVYNPQTQEVITLYATCYHDRLVQVRTDVPGRLHRDQADHCLITK